MDTAQQPRKGEGGDFTEAYTDEAFVTAVERLEGPTGCSTSDVADAVGCGYATAYRRLTELARSGAVSRVDDEGRFRWFSAGVGGG